MFQDIFLFILPCLLLLSMLPNAWEVLVSKKETTNVSDILTL